MANAVRLIPVLLVLVIVTAASAMHEIDDPYYAPEGIPTIDADLSDWADAEWILMDETYAGTVTDITEAKYAVKWSSSTNLLYMAVSVVDTNLMLEDWYVDWNMQDDIEVYVDAGQNDIAYTGLQDYAQQLQIGAAATPGEPPWATWYSAAAIGTDVIPEFAAVVTGNTITYEVSIVPHSYYTGRGGTALPNTIVTLTDGLDVGLDVVATSRDGSTYGMACNNMYPYNNKFKWSYSFQTWVLGDPPVLEPDADLDGDGDVDLDDFVILKSSFGLNDNGDCDHDGDTDLDDFVILKQQFGT